jgi:DNA-binding GntR family transcriptional regulator
MTDDRPIFRRVLADQVKERLLDDILSGRLPPDARIIETAIAKDLGISQAPVREALRGLEALGVVEITPFRGARVRRPTRREIVEAYDVRSALETLGARLAVPKLTGAELAELAGLLAAMRAAADRDESAVVAEHDARFHGRLLEIADNATLLRVWGTLEPLSRTYLTVVGPGADLHWSAELHAPILAMLERRDVDGVVAALDAHFDQVRDSMAARWPEDAELPHVPVDGAPATAVGA